MTPVCKCSHDRSVHAAGDPLEPCKPSCGCLEFRLDPRSRLRDEPGEAGDATGDAA